MLGSLTRGFTSPGRHWKQIIEALDDHLADRVFAIRGRTRERMAMLLDEATIFLERSVGPPGALPLTAYRSLTGLHLYNAHLVVASSFLFALRPGMPTKIDKLERAMPLVYDQALNPTGFYRHLVEDCEGLGIYAWVPFAGSMLARTLEPLGLGDDHLLGCLRARTARHLERAIDDLPRCFPETEALTSR